jgi:ATP-dependent Lhr-like helicase
VLQSFHPLLARWFEQTLGAPTPAQLRGWDAIRAGRHTLIAAPTGSGKTLAAFLIALDELVRESLSGELPDEVRTVYVSPLKALSADIHKNLAEPRAAVRRIAQETGMAIPRVTAAVRTGDTPAAERAAMLRVPPHILVTTPESLYLLLTAERSRELLRSVRTVIVDEIHAVIGTRRGAHLALTLERLAGVAQRPPQRIGLSATQRPVEEVARYLVGAPNVAPGGTANCVVIDEGHRRAMDVALELPGSPLEAVMAGEVWEEYYDRLAALIEQHKTTLVFVNTRRMVERVARHLCDRLGDAAVAAHHGSLSKERRLDAEDRLKRGQIRALVATASLELGIDIGHVDLVCQLGSPHRIATLLQRVGRAGHTIHGTPKGRLFPVTRDDLAECTALLRAIRRGELDRILTFDAPLDVLAQQIVAESACEEYAEDDLFTLVRRAWPYRDLKREDFNAVLTMLAEGFTTRRGRRAALIHRDEVNGRVRGRRAARLTAITSGGAIPDNADYRVLLDPDDLFIGTLNEDFAIESMAGDVFQLGNRSWRILRVGSGVVRVEDAHGAPPNIPFWLGEAPARSDELSTIVSDLRQDIAPRLDVEDTSDVVTWLVEETGVNAAAAEQLVAYLSESLRMLGALPTQHTLVLERFFDESGGMQLVLHAPFGSRVNRAWGLALRKRFCRQFNFELQAAATEDAVLLSLGPQHSFPLADVFRYLHPATVRDVLVQAFLDAPVFQTRWRWNTTIALAVPRARHGTKVPPQLQRMQADDLLAAAFPDAAACLENIPGDRQVPDHPLVKQTVRDCLEEAMDLPGLIRVLERIRDGQIECVARDTPEPSPLAHEILNARPYAFLDDAPLEERRAHAVMARRAMDPGTAADMGALDGSAVARVREEAWPDPRDPDELHDALLTAGYLTRSELSRIPNGATWARELADAGRVTCVVDRSLTEPVWVAAERLPEITALAPTARWDPAIVPPASRATREWTREQAAGELLRGRLALTGPITAEALGESVSLAPAEVSAALHALEQEGVVLRGRFEGRGEEWCDRRLLARIHRYTLNRLRAEIQPVTPGEFMRFLFVWQHVGGASRVTGLDGLRHVVAQLDGMELPASAWERHVLPARVQNYEPSMLDLLCFSGEVGWCRFATQGVAAEARTRSAAGRPIRSTPITVFRRDHEQAWRTLAGTAGQPTAALGSSTAAVLATLRERGALFVHEIVAATGLVTADVQRALAELVVLGVAASDGFGGLRAMVARRGPGAVPPPREALRRDLAGALAKAGGERALPGSAFHTRRPANVGAGGRWSVVASETDAGASSSERGAAIELQARVLLQRYGVMFRRLLARESNAVSWRELLIACRRLEARGEIRGGRFVSGMSGEQFALPDAVVALRETRRTAPTGELITISGADPLNLVGIVTGGDRVAAIARSRIVFRDGIPLAALEGDYIRPINEYEASAAAPVARALAGRPTAPAVTSGFVGRELGSG